MLNTVRLAVEHYPITGEELYRMSNLGPVDLDVAPELIVEVLSPNDAWSEVQEKLAESFAINVKVVWGVDPKLQ